MEDADSSQESVKPPTGDGKEPKQKLANSARIYWVGLFVITVAALLSKFPIPWDWVGMAQSNETSQVATEEVVVTNGKSTKTITTIKTEPAKTFWDWMSLLLAPAALAGLGFVLQSSQERAKVAREELENRAEEAAKTRAAEQAQAEKVRADNQARAEKVRADNQAQAEKERAEDRQRDDAIEAYINSISDLWIGKSLSILVKPSKTMLDMQQQDLLDASMDVIRARTLSIFRRLTDDKDPERTDGERKGSILLFLYETGLIRNLKSYERGQEVVTEPKRLQALLSLFGASLDFAELSSTTLSDINLRGAYLNHANLSGAKLARANFIESYLYGAYLVESDLSCANFIESDLSRADLNGANLSGANLSGANLSGANLSNANLYRVNLNHANLTGTNLSNASVGSANLNHANLTGANLSDANLSSADLNRALLCGTQLSGADLSDATLRGTILLAVDLSLTKSLTPKQLEGYASPSLCKVRLPKQIEVDPNRDCKNLPGALLAKNLEQVENLTEAQAYVDAQPQP